MVYGYVRVSTDKQTVANQEHEILKFANTKGIQVEEWLRETASGTKSAEKRELGALLKRLKKDDVIIVSELSRIGRSLMDVMEVLNGCMKKEVAVYSVKEGFNLDGTVNSQVMAFAFSLSAEIERQLISQRTKEALNRKRHEGMKLGRPKGSVNKTTKLTGKENEVSDLIAKKVPVATIGKIYNVNRATVQKFINRIKR